MATVSASLSPGKELGAADQDDYFDFLGLPREMRDKVYDELLLAAPKIRLPSRGLILQISGYCELKRTTPLRAMMVCRQLRDERNDRAKLLAVFVAKDNYGGIYPSWQDVPLTMRNFKLHLLMLGDDVCRCDTINGDRSTAGDLREHLDLFRSLLGKAVVPVQTLSVRLYTKKREHWRAVLQHQRMLTEFKEMTSFKMRYAPGPPIMSTSNELVLTWSPRDRVIKKVGGSLGSQGETEIAR